VTLWSGGTTRPPAADQQAHGRRGRSSGTDNHSKLLADGGGHVRMARAARKRRAARRPARPGSGSRRRASGTGAQGDGPGAGQRLTGAGAGSVRAATTVIVFHGASTSWTSQQPATRHARPRWRGNHRSPGDQAERDASPDATLLRRAGPPCCLGAARGHPLPRPLLFAVWVLSRLPPGRWWPWAWPRQPAAGHRQLRSAAADHPQTSGEPGLSCACSGSVDATRWRRPVRRGSFTPPTCGWDPGPAVGSDCRWRELGGARGRPGRRRGGGWRGRRRRGRGPRRQR
jgi:hypothetical protein